MSAGGFRLHRTLFAPLPAPKVRLSAARADHEFGDLKTVRISSKRDVEGRRIVAEIGQISAASIWHSGAGPADSYKEGALEKLKRLAREFEADAIVDLDYTVDDVVQTDLAPMPLKRISARGVAVKLARV